MEGKFYVLVENLPNVTESKDPHVARFDVYMAGDHLDHTSDEHTGFYMVVRLGTALPTDTHEGYNSGGELNRLLTLSQEAHSYVEILLQAAIEADNFKYDTDNCESCRRIIHSDV